MIKGIGNEKRIEEKLSHARIQEVIRKTARNRREKSCSAAFADSDCNDLCFGFFCIDLRSTQLHLRGVVQSTDGDYHPDDGYSNTE